MPPSLSRPAGGLPQVSLAVTVSLRSAVIVMPLAVTVTVTVGHGQRDGHARAGGAGSR